MIGKCHSLRSLQYMIQWLWPPNLNYMVRIPKWANLKEFFLNLFPFWTPQIVPKTGQNHPKMSQKGTLSLDLTNPLGVWITPSSTRGRVFTPVWQPHPRILEGFSGRGWGFVIILYIYGCRKIPPTSFGGNFPFCKKWNYLCCENATSNFGGEFSASRFRKIPPQKFQKVNSVIFSRKFNMGKEVWF